MRWVQRMNEHAPLPFVVFVTAHHRYALKAFDVDAVDYLLKPYDDERFFAALDKAKRSIGMRRSTRLTGKLMDLVREHMQENGTFTERFAIKEKGREHVVHVDDGVPARRGQLPVPAVEGPALPVPHDHERRGK
jgi:DNA-binding LytR/AlgR family response regulator